MSIFQIIPAKEYIRGISRIMKFIDYTNEVNPQNTGNIICIIQEEDVSRFLR